MAKQNKKYAVYEFDGLDWERADDKEYKTRKSADNRSNKLKLNAQKNYTGKKLFSARLL